MNGTLLALALIAWSDPAPIAVKAPRRTTPVSYAREVGAILAGKCVGCHNATVAQGKLNMEDVAGMRKGGKRGPSIVAGKPDEGPLFGMAAHRVEPTMPPKEKKDHAPLTPEELGLLQRWIGEGARDDSAEVEAAAAAEPELGPLPAGIVAVAALDLTADGRRIALGRANVVEVVDVDTGLPIATLRGHKDIVQSVRFRPDGRQLAVGGYREVLVWDAPFVEEGDAIKAHPPGVIVIAATADGGRVASAAGGSIRLWDMTTNMRERTWKDLGADVASLVFSADGKRLVAGLGDATIRVFNLNDGAEVLPRRAHDGPVTSLAIAGDRLASGSADGTARLWPLAGESTLWKHPKPVRAVAASGDGSVVVTGADDGIVRIYAGGNAREVDAKSGAIRSLAVDSSGATILAGCAEGARLIDAGKGEVVKILRGPGAAVAIAPGGGLLAAAGPEGVMVWDASGAVVVGFAHGVSAESKPTAATSLLFLDAEVLATAGADGSIKTWDVTGRWSGPRRLGPHVGRVLSLDYSPDGKLLAAGGGEPSRSGEVKLWDVEKGTAVRSLAEGLHSDNVCALRFSPDGTKLATGAADKFLKVVNVADGKEVRSMEGHTGHVLAVDWKADGKQLVTGSADGSIKLWEAETGDQVRTYLHNKAITSARWIAGTTKVFVGSGDKTARLWDAESGSVERTHDGPGDYVDCVATSRDGSRRAAGVADGGVFLWRADGGLIRKLSP